MPSSGQNETAQRPDEGSSGFDKLKQYAQQEFVQPVLALGSGGLLASWITDFLQQELAQEPWQSVWVLIPLGIFTYYARSAPSSGFQLRGRFLTFFVVYIALFTVLVKSHLFEIKQPVLTGYEGKAAHSRMTPHWLGDWRYVLAGRATDARGLTVVTLSPPETIEARRSDLLFLLRMARNNQARGVALDIHFDREGQAQIGRILCSEIEAARQSGIPVLAGYTLKVLPNEVRRRTKTTPSLAGCLPLQEQGHLVGYLDWDGRARHLPLHFLGDPRMPAFSLRVASLLAGRPWEELAQPADGLLRFIAPREDPLTVRFEVLKADSSLAALLRDQFVLVGEDSAQDRFHTPYGEKAGVMIHAYAALSLAQGLYIQGTPLWISFGLISLACYWIVLLARQGKTGRQMALYLLAASAAFLTASVLSMHFLLIWVDAAYFLTATWLLLLLMLLLRKRLGQAP